MPLKGARYRMKATPKGNVRLAFKGNRVVEAKSMSSGKIHTPAEFAADRRKTGLERLMG